MSATSSTPLQENIVKLDVAAATPSLTTLVWDAGANGLALDVNNTILGCSHARQAIVSFDPVATTPAIAELITSIDVAGVLSYFNSTNDLVVRSDGAIYFTDPTYHQGEKTPLVGTRGVYRVPPDRTSVEAFYTSSSWQPNGIALSPDERMLYVSDSQSSTIFSFPLTAGGALAGVRSTFSSNIGTPDGATVDCAGNVYFTSKTSSGYVRIIGPTGTTKLQISLAGVSNVAFGGPDHKTLYLTAGRSVYSLPMNIPGFPD